MLATAVGQLRTIDTSSDKRLKNALVIWLVSLAFL